MARSGQVRIIAGRWRGRRIPVPPVPGLRPSPDRVRETLFNWLQPHLPGARCLDLFAGTGVLGLEALSRGAGGLVALDRHPRVVAHLRGLADQLDAAGLVRVICADACRWLQAGGGGIRPGFDLVFLDPPFRRGLVDRCLRRLVADDWLARPAWIYVEAERAWQPAALPPGLRVVRSRAAGQLGYHLLQAGIP